jgi:hypothetical protein
MLNRSVRRGLAAVILGLLVCGNVVGTTRKELSVLFIGNSLTYVNDVPAIVAAIAEADGRKRIIYQTVAFPDFSLEDHWRHGDARKAIADGRWDFVVLQQGPSALPASRALLLEYTRRFGADINRVGAQPALYMVWPSAARQGDFDRVSESYRLASKDVGGLLFPVGEAWRAAWRRNPRLALYSSDGLHPTVLGSYLAALVIYENLCVCAPTKLPTRLVVRSRVLREINLRAEDAETLQEAAREASRQTVGVLLRNH